MWYPFRDILEKEGVTMNPMDYMKVAGMWKQFTDRHPKFAQFLGAMMQNRITEGTIIDIQIKSPDGKEICSNMRITAEDMALFEEIKNMKR